MRHARWGRCGTCRRRRRLLGRPRSRPTRIPAGQRCPCAICGERQPPPLRHTVGTGAPGREAAGGDPPARLRSVRPGRPAPRPSRFPDPPRAPQRGALRALTAPRPSRPPSADRTRRRGRRPGAATSPTRHAAPTPGGNRSRARPGRPRRQRRPRRRARDRRARSLASGGGRGGAAGPLRGAPAPRARACTRHSPAGCPGWRTDIPRAVQNERSGEAGGRPAHGGRTVWVRVSAIRPTGASTPVVAQASAGAQRADGCGRSRYVGAGMRISAVRRRALGPGEAALRCAGEAEGCG